MTRASQDSPAAPFVSGSITRHLLVMTVMGAIGLMALFLVDFVDLWFVSLLKDVHATAALGFGGTLGFMHLSLQLGLGITTGALVSIHAGREERERARSLAASALKLALAGGLAFTLLTWITAEWLLQALGAQGRALALGVDYLRILSLGFPLLGGTLVFSFTLRGFGQPTLAMLTTLATAITNALLDPLFIFMLDMGVAGAAAATVCANLVAFAIGGLGLARHLKRLSPGADARALARGETRADMPKILGMGIPITLTQLATPVLAAYLMFAAARFGPEAVAAMTVINRLAPLAFGIVFSLSGAVGPVIGQNHGAGLMDRVRRAYLTGLTFAFAYTLFTWLMLVLLADAIVAAFALTGETADLVRLFCQLLAGAWVFTGGQFVAQAAFNNMERPRLSLLFNWARATVGTMLPVELLALHHGPRGVLIGAAIGSALVGLVAMITAWRIIEGRAAMPPPAAPRNGAREARHRA